MVDVGIAHVRTREAAVAIPIAAGCLKPVIRIESAHQPETVCIAFKRCRFAQNTIFPIDLLERRHKNFSLGGADRT